MDKQRSLSQGSDLKRKSQPLEPRDDNREGRPPEQPAKQLKQPASAENSDDDLFVPPEPAHSEADSDHEDLVSSSSDDETQGFDLDGYLRFRGSLDKVEESLDKPEEDEP